jgi:hypothetical protein
MGEMMPEIEREGFAPEEETPESPTIPENVGLEIRLGTPAHPAGGAARYPVHGAYKLASPRPARRIVLIALLDGSTQVFSGAAVQGGPPAGAIPPPPNIPGVVLAKGTLVGGFFNMDLYRDLDLPPSGGTYYLTAQCGGVRSEVVKVELPSGTN